jgi:putative component of toxin-antitoxin plasmid stabilization module
VEERYQGILADAGGFLLSPDLNFDTMTAAELKNVCRSRHLRGWSNLRRDDLLAFVKQQLASEIKISHILQRQKVDQATDEATDEATSEGVAESQADRGPGYPVDASRTERLLLLLLQHLNVPQEQIQTAWQDPAAA